MIVASALAVVLAGCGAQTPPDTTMVISSDPELRAVVGELLPGLAERAGLELREPVRVERRTRAELESYLVAKLDEDLAEEEARNAVRAYALLGMVPEDLDLRALLLDVYTEQVAGFYDPDSTALFVLDDQPTEVLTTLLVHELVHAVQDQATNLDSITHRDRGSDRQTAAQAAIEGHATLVMFEYMTEQLQGRPVDLTALPDFASQLRPSLEAIRSEYPALSRAPRVIQEAMLFPYLEGAGFVQALWRARGGRPAPFGADLPQSTEQVVDPARFVGETPDHPATVTLTLLDAAATHEDGLGQLEARIFVRELVGEDVPGAAAGWDGDRFALVEREGRPGLVWVSVWDDVEARDRFVDMVSDGVRTLSGGASVRPGLVDGRPVAFLEIGDVGAYDVAVSGG